jgi:uncharacterized protein YebE (UPF0316 family)
MNIEFFNESNIWVYIVIFSLKFIEVTVSTLRIVIVTKGERLKGAFIAFFEVMLWVFVASLVIDGITKDPIKIVIYGAAFASGNYLGSILEEKLALGTINLQAIVSESLSQSLVSYIRDEGYAVTTVNGEGLESKKTILYMHTPRKKVKELIQLLRNQVPSIVITIHEIRPIYGGFRSLRK